MNIISLFDGHSSLQFSLRKVYNNFKYYSSEISSPAIKVTQKHFPNTIQMGNVSDITDEYLQSITSPLLLSGGSPCTDLSIAGTKSGMTTQCNIEITSLNQYLSLKNDNFNFKGQSYLFWEFARVLHITKPKYFFFENVTMNGKLKKYENLISQTLGVLPIKINSKFFLPQNRNRLYWTNIPLPNNIPNTITNISDVIPDALSGCGKRSINKIPKWTTRKDNIANCITRCHNTRHITLKNLHKRPLTVNECETLQGLPIDYTNSPGVTKTHRFDMIGNGWTIPVIDMFINNIPELK